MVELLAPVGSREAFYAAISSGADAIYLGGRRFGARAYANNFSDEELIEMIKIAHSFDVLVYVTINTIIFEDEIEDLIKFIDLLYLNDVDAIIIQDIGLLNIVRNRYPNLEIHASTQMNIHSVSEAKVLKDLGVSRIVVSREINLDQIKKIKAEVGIEIEVFIHGALCVSSSGNCFISSIIGKRSGNRGRCAQPCRLPYSLNGESGYLISPKDLYSLDNIEQLLTAGIDSLKIEGRMKRPEYVAQVVKSYKKAINNYYFGEEYNIDNEEFNLRKIFNRSFTKGYLFNTEDEDFVNKLASNHQGVKVGEVIYSHNNTVKIALTKPLSKGDSIRLVGKLKDVITVNQMYVNNKLKTIANIGEVVSLRSHIDGLIGAEVYLTTSSEQISNLEKTYKDFNKKIYIDGNIDLVDDYLRLTLRYKDYKFVKTSKEKIQIALKQPTNPRILDQMRKTNDTIFVFDKLTLDINKDIFIGIKDLNEFRRTALDEFREVIAKKHHNRKIQDINLNIPKVEPNTKKIIVKIRTRDQLNEVLKYKVDEIYFTNLDLYEEYKNELTNIYYVEPRVLLEDIKYPYPLVVSKLGYYDNFKTSIYLNVTNSYSINLLENLGAKSIGLSLELSLTQIESIIESYKLKYNRLPNLEMNVYGRYELMMLKYKLGLSKEYLNGNSLLFDRKGFSFPVLLEDDYVKILNSKRLHLIDYLNKLSELNISQIIEFTIETEAEIKGVMDIYINKNIKELYDVTNAHIIEGVL